MLQNQKLLSIIVPSYNMEAYLPKCLGSLIVDDKELLQRLDVIVVNDGSKDRTSEIAHEFEAKYPGVFRVVDKENGNYGSCINAALSMVTGEFVKVLDADDWFSKENLAKYLLVLEGFGISSPDLIITDYDIVDEKKGVQEHYSYQFCPDSEFDILDFVNAKAYVPMHAYTYRTNVLKSMRYRQLEGVSYTDTEWVLLPLSNVSKIRYVPLLIYHYLQGREGQTMEINKIVESWWMRGEIALDLLNWIKKEEWCKNKELRLGLESKIEMMLKYFYRGAIVGVLGHSVKIDLKEFDNRLKVLSSAWYDRMGSLCYSQWLPFRFIKRWRRATFIDKVMILMCRCIIRS